MYWFSLQNMASLYPCQGNEYHINDKWDACVKSVERYWWYSVSGLLLASVLNLPLCQVKCLRQVSSGHGVCYCFWSRTLWNHGSPWQLVSLSSIPLLLMCRPIMSSWWQIALLRTSLLHHSMGWSCSHVLARWTLFTQIGHGGPRYLWVSAKSLRA